MAMTVERRLWLMSVADAIAERHVKRGWFESDASCLARKIRLRTDIRNAMIEAARQAAKEGG